MVVKSQYTEGEKISKFFLFFLPWLDECVSAVGRGLVHRVHGAGIIWKSGGKKESSTGPTQPTTHS